jgi:ankyrin repeat domain-containing protein 50
MSASFIYCRYTERLSLIDVLAAVVKQNLLKHPKLLPLVRPLYDRHVGEGTAPTRHELTALLAAFTKQFGVNFYSLDGLDEALEEVRSDLLRILASLKVNLCVTSRPLKGLEHLLPNARHFYIVALRDDLRLMILQKVEHNGELRDVVGRRPELLDEITSLIYEKAGGM